MNKQTKRPHQNPQNSNLLVYSENQFWRYCDIKKKGKSNDTVNKETEREGCFE